MYQVVLDRHKLESWYWWEVKQTSPLMYYFPCTILYQVWDTCWSKSNWTFPSLLFIVKYWVSFSYSRASFQIFPYLIEEQTFLNIMNSYGKIPFTGCNIIYLLNYFLNIYICNSINCILLFYLSIMFHLSYSGKDCLNWLLKIINMCEESL